MRPTGWETALMYAVVGGHYETVLFLLENGADILHYNHFGDTVEAMIYNSRNEILKDMIKRKSEEYRSSLIYRMRRVFGFE